MSLTWEAMVNAVRKRYKEQVADTLHLPTVYDNDGTQTKPNSDVWARVTVLPGESTIAELGKSKRYRNPGVLMVSVFVPVGKGDAPAYSKADAIKFAFRCVSQYGVVYRTPFVTVVGKVNAEWQINVSCPFYADDVN